MKKEFEKNVLITGLIGCGREKLHHIHTPGAEVHYHVTKIWLDGNGCENQMKMLYPDAEITNDIRTMINDDSIQVVILSKPNRNDMTFIGEFLEAGKHVRII